jgi:hypothetical protein
LFSDQPPGAAEWVRNPDWIDLPEHDPSDERIDILFAVGDWSSNPVAFVMQGDYHVDWGDGNDENVTSNVQAEHNFDYDDLDPETEFVVGGTTYRQAIITVTPQTSEALTLVDFNRKHTGFVPQYATAMMDMRLSVPNCTSLIIGGANAPRRGLERVDWLSTGTLTSMGGMFFDCNSLQSIPAFPGSVASVTNMGSMFSGCNSLQSIPAFTGSVASVTNRVNMFTVCSSLQSIPAFPGSVASVTNMLNMFLNCNSLQSIPAFPGSVASVTTMQSMFQNCNSLQSIPAFPGSVASVTNMGNMFLNCNSLALLGDLPGVTLNFSVASCLLGRDELVSVFTNLPDRTSLDSRTITITNNPGASELSAADLEIATDKNWVVAD